VRLPGGGAGPGGEWTGAPLLHGSVRFHGERFEFTLESALRLPGVDEG